MIVAITMLGRESPHQRYFGNVDVDVDVKILVDEIEKYKEEGTKQLQTIVEIQIKGLTETIFLLLSE